MKEYTENRNGKKGVLVVSFGTSCHETRRRTIDVCEEKIAQDFPGYEMRRTPGRASLSVRDSLLRYIFTALARIPCFRISMSGMRRMLLERQRVTSDG